MSDEPRWWADPHDDDPNPDGCVGCLLLDPDLTPHENMEEAYTLGYHYGAGHEDGPRRCARCPKPITAGEPP
jgi:hypothetical protein